MQKVIVMLTLEEFVDIFERLFTPLCLFANKYVDDRNLAKDIVHDVFLKVWEHDNPIKDKTNLDGFFYSAVRRKSIDYLRSKYAKDVKAYSHKELEPMLNENDFIRESLILDTTAIVQAAILKLPPKAAEVIRLHIEEKSNNDIADELNISVNTVKKHKQKVFKKLRELLAHIEFD